MAILNRNFRSWLATCILLVALTVAIPAVASQALGTKELLHLSFDDLMNVKIMTAGKRDEPISDIPASVVVISRADIAVYGYTTLAEILQSVPGLYYIDDYAEGGPNFGVRGFWSGVANDNMIFLVNGVPQTNDVFSNYPISDLAVPVEAIDRIEVIRGPMSVMYGNGAFYGAVNIITNETESEQITQVVSATIGSHRTGKFFVRSSGRGDDFKYVFNLSVYDTYGLNSPLSAMTSDTASLAGYGLSGGSTTGGLQENREMRVGVSGSFRNIYINISGTEVDDEPYFDPPSFSTGIRSRTNVSRVVVGYKRGLSDRVAVDGRLSYHSTRIDWQYDFFHDSFYAVQHIWANAYNLELDLFVDLSPQVSVIGGLSRRAIVDASNMFDLPSFGVPSLNNNRIMIVDGDNIVTQAAYAQLTYQASTKLSVVVGGRLEHSPAYRLDARFGQGTPAYERILAEFNRDEVEFMPRFSMIYRPSTRHVLKFMYGKAINRPSFFQNYLAVRDTARTDLEPERIQTLELNYLTEFSKGLSASISVFRNTLDNLITRVIEYDTSEVYTSWSENAGRMITNGFELTVRATPVHDFGADFSASYQITEDRRPGFEDIDVAYSPHFLANFKAVYDVRENVTLAAVGNYVDGMQTYWDETKTDSSGDVIVNAQGVSGGRIGMATTGQFTLGLNLRIEEVFGTKWYFSIKGVNLLDEDVRFPTFTNTRWADKGTLGMGRSFFVTLGRIF